jgi:DNA-binding CsgD family transcriptional regulator
MEPQAWASNLQHLASFVESDRALLAVNAGCGGKRMAIATPGMNIQAKLSAYDRARGRQYYHTALGRLPPGIVTTPGTLMPHIKYSENWWWREIAFPQGFSDFIGGHLLKTPASYAWLSIGCPADKGFFRPEELQCIQTLAPQLQHAARVFMRYSDDWMRAQGFEPAFERLNFGVLTVDVEGRLLFFNKFAERMILKQDGLVLKKNALSCVRPSDSRSLAAAIAAIAKGQSRSCEVIVTRQDKRPLLLHLCASSPSYIPSDSGASKPVTILLSDPDRQFDAPVASFAAAYSLTSAETRFLKEILSGMGLPRAAERLRISQNTARTHLQRIFAKTNASNQLELIRIFSGSLPPLSN